MGGGLCNKFFLNIDAGFKGEKYKLGSKSTLQETVPHQPMLCHDGQQSTRTVVGQGGDLPRDRLLLAWTSLFCVPSYRSKKDTNILKKKQLREEKRSNRITNFVYKSVLTTKNKN